MLLFLCCRRIKLFLTVSWCKSDIQMHYSCKRTTKKNQFIERIVGNRIGCELVGAKTASFCFYFEAPKARDYRLEPLPHYNSFNFKLILRVVLLKLFNFQNIFFRVDKLCNQLTVRCRNTVFLPFSSHKAVQEVHFSKAVVLN